MAGQGLLPGPQEAAVFAAAVLVLNATPGVDFALTVSRTLQGGARAGVAAALGIAAGCVVHVLAAAGGLAALLALQPRAFALLRLAGAAYLAWLGAGLLRRAWLGTPAAAAAPASSARRLAADFRAGLLTNVLNPKVALFMLAFLPQFVPADAWSAQASFLVLGAWFVVQGALFLLALVAVVVRLRRLGASSHVVRGLQATGGLIFGGLAWRMLRS